MLTIVKPTDAVVIKNLITVIYGQPSLGKTSMAFTAQNPFLIDFDGRAHIARNRKDYAKVDSWLDAALINEEALHEYDTVVVDTVGRALDCITTHLQKTNPESTQKDGSLTMKGFGTLKTAFNSFLSRIRGYGKDIVLIAHMDEQRKAKGDGSTYRIDVQGGSKNEVYKLADLMGMLYIDEDRRVIDFTPRESSYGKDPVGLGCVTVPSYVSEPLFLAKILADTKAKISSMSESAAEENARLESLAVDFASLENLDEINSAVARMVDNNAKQSDKALLAKAAKEKGFKFNSKTKAFE